jgi:hypothetical protein
VVIITKASNRARVPNATPAITTIAGANFGKVFSTCALIQAYAAALQGQETHLGLLGQPAHIGTYGRQVGATQDVTEIAGRRWLLVGLVSHAWNSSLVAS